MLIKEFALDYDIADDLHFFIYNDPETYKKIFYPYLLQLKKHIKSNKQCPDLLFKSCINKAFKDYCKKYNITINTKSVFTDTDRDQLARKIFGQEIDNIKKGVYD